LELETKIRELREAALAQAREARSADDLADLRVKYLGRKGLLTGVLRGMAALDAASRPAVGRLANAVKEEIEDLVLERTDALARTEMDRNLTASSVDVTLPGVPVGTGGLHPLTLVRQEIEDIFVGLGFTVVEGPEVELDYYNFEALNMGPDHPARDMWDTFFLDEGVLLRTHTSPVQVRTMEKTAPAVPIRILAPGKVYRRDDDATHAPMFHQVEGLMVDRRVRLSDLKGVLAQFARQIFSPDIRTRFRASYFPFTEPSAEMDISCVMCGGDGCRVCSQTGWLEILGSGMVHPRVLAMSGYDPSQVSGFAFGMGIERIAMLKYGIDDLRVFLDNDLRFLTQF
jgi:phenylalanyl-tRNA synthetase alpha chain